MFKGKKMAGHMGDTQVTIQNLEVVSTDTDRGLILVKGAIPGAQSGWVRIKDAVKKVMPNDLPFPAAIREAAAPVTEEAAPSAEVAAETAAPEGEQKD